MDDLITDNIIIEIDQGPEYDTTHVGICLTENNEVAIFVNFDCDKKILDGFSVFRSSNINQYRIADEYTYKAEDLESFKSQINLSNCTNFSATLSYASKFNLIAIFEQGDDDGYYVGSVNSISDDEVSFDLVDQDGENTRVKLFKFEDISHFSFYTRYEIGLAK